MFLDYGVVGIRAAVEQPLRGHDEARRAIAALGRAAGFERGLQRVRFAIARHALDGGELRAVGPHGEDQTGKDGFAVQMNGATPARSLIAAAFGSDEPEVVTEDVEQYVVRTYRGLDPTAVDFEPDELLLWHAESSVKRRGRYPHAGTPATP